MTAVVGLTGGIGSGKSTVARMLQALGATLIDADAIVRELQAPGTALLARIAAEFGDEILDARGALDRERLAAIVFQDEKARVRLEHIVHPAVRAEMTRRITKARAAGAPLVVLDIPLLFEGRAAATGSEAQPELDATLVVWVPAEIQIQRALARDRCSREEVLRRIGAQLPLDRKREMADYSIDNSVSLAETERQVRAFYESVTAPAAAP